MSLRGVNQPGTNPLLGTLGRPLAPNGGASPGAAGGANGAAPDGARGLDRSRGQSPAARPAGGAPNAARATGAALSAGTALPTEAPPGTDPALWSVLTGEERAFFAKAAASGPLTYSRISAGVRELQGQTVPAGAPALLGGRLDVRG